MVLKILRFTALGLAPLVLVFMVRGRGARVQWLTGAGALAPALAFAVFWAVVFPVNQEMARWIVDAVPQDWVDWRDRWEYGHAARALLLTAGFWALICSVLAETPAAEQAPGRPV